MWGKHRFSQPRQPLGVDRTANRIEVAQPRVLKIDQQTSTSIRQPESHLQRPVVHAFRLRGPVSSFSHEIPLFLATSTLG
jgi:hypothetical protein